MLGGDRLRERRVERRHEGQLDPVAHLAVVEVPVGEEGELERGDGALDRHVDAVHDHASRVERPKCLRERRCALRGVEGEDVLHPAWAAHALGVLGLEAGARCDDQDVVGERCSVSEVDEVRVELDPVDLRLEEPDAVPQLALPGAGDLVCVGEAERDEQEARLVDVAVVPVDDGDLRLGVLVGAPEPVCHHRAAGPAAEDHDPLGHHRAPPVCLSSSPPSVPGKRGVGIGRSTQVRSVASTQAGNGRRAVWLRQAPEVAGQPGGVQDRLVLLPRVRAPAG